MAVPLENDRFVIDPISSTSSSAMTSGSFDVLVYLKAELPRLIKDELRNYQRMSVTESSSSTRQILAHIAAGRARLGLIKDLIRLWTMTNKNDISKDMDSYAPHSLDMLQQDAHAAIKYIQSNEGYDS